MTPLENKSLMVLAAILMVLTACHPVRLNDLSKWTVFQSEVGNLQLLKDAVKKDPSVLVTQDRFLYRNCLHWGARCGDLDLTKQALAAGANIEAHDRYGSTPLDLAAKYGYVQVGRLLLDHGASVKARDLAGYTPLHSAAGLRCDPMVELLLDRGAQIDAKDFGGDTPLELAIAAWQLDSFSRTPLSVVELLLKRGANPQPTNAWNQTPLHTASMYGYSEVAERLLERGADSNARSKYNTPVCLAARFLQPEMVKLLIRHGAKVNVDDYQGVPVLYEAIDALGKSDKRSERKQAEIVELLLDAGADPNRLGKGTDSSPLQHAARDGDLAVAKALLAHGAQINYANRYGITALYCAVNGRHMEMVKLLVENSADVNACGPGGHTPISITWGTGYGEIKEYLMKHGAR